MPELRFVIGWPDGSRETCYSPSTIIRAYFVAGTTYPLPDFVITVRAALNAASERVRAVHGSPCSLALGQLARIEETAERFAGDGGAGVIFMSFKE
jgi:uncharacterized repeat protein (TIGR04042 family)